ncbi:hypothetical protein C8R46DRAFT_1348612 [Mycena filopes]|nr:hypothetical protein C8R46DRAFT_1348612 [Mycena filopes]
MSLRKLVAVSLALILSATQVTMPAKSPSSPSSPPTELLPCALSVLAGLLVPTPTLMCPAHASSPPPPPTDLLLCVLNVIAELLAPPVSALVCAAPAPRPTSVVEELVPATRTGFFSAPAFDIAANDTRHDLIDDDSIDLLEQGVVLALDFGNTVLPSRLRPLAIEVSKVVGRGRLKKLLRGQDLPPAFFQVGQGVGFRFASGYASTALAGVQLNIRWRRHWWKVLLPAVAGLAFALALFRLDAHVQNIDDVERLLVSGLGYAPTMLSLLRCGRVWPMVVSEIRGVLGSGRLRALMNGVGWDVASRAVACGLMKKVAFSYGPSWALALWRDCVYPAILRMMALPLVVKVLFVCLVAALVCSALVLVLGLKMDALPILPPTPTQAPTPSIPPLPPPTPLPPGKT